jgi:hypothetical protein
MDQQQQGGPGGSATSVLLQCGSVDGTSGSGSSWATSGYSSPVGSGTLSVTDRTGSASASFLRSLVGRQTGKGSGRCGVWGVVCALVTACRLHVCVMQTADGQARTHCRC